MMPLFGGLLLILRVHHAFAVTELTDTNFYDYAKDKDVLLVDFYAPWCSDCKALDPDFENAAANLGTRSVDLAKVDCFGAGKGLCGTYGVKRWPTLKNFNRGQYTGDYTGGLTSAEIAGYISTVENSVHPVVNPYAAPFNPQPAAVQTEQCVTKCKISRLSNKQRCFEGCKAKSYGKKVMLPQPVINEKSCAKCRQPQVAGKYSHICAHRLRKACRRYMRHIRHKGVKCGAKKQKNKKSTLASKKATIGTLTSATNDNVVKLSMSEPLIIPPNAAMTHKHHRAEEMFIHDNYDRTETAISLARATDISDFNPTNNDGGKRNALTDREQALRLISDADDKKKPVLSVGMHPPQQDRYIRIPPHDSGDKKGNAAKPVKDVKYPLPKVTVKKVFKPNLKLKFSPKFLTIKVPPHDSGDLTTSPQGSRFPKNAVQFIKFKGTHKADIMHGVSPGIQRVGFIKNIRHPNISPKLPEILQHIHQNSKVRQTVGVIKQLNKPINRYIRVNEGAPLLPLVKPVHPPMKKGIVKVPAFIQNGTSIALNSHLVPKENTAISKKISVVKGSSPVHQEQLHKKLEAMSPREALKVPYDINDRKRTIQ